MNSGYGSIVAPSLTAQTTGKTFYVQSPVNANAQMIQDLFVLDTDGVQRVFSTIALALTQTTAGAGDVIYVAPGYVETITTAGGTTVATSGVSIIGLGKGNLRPTVTFTTAVAASWIVSGANVTLQNIIFTCNINTQTQMVSVTGADCAIRNCYFNVATAGAIGAAIGVNVTAADRFIMDSCNLIGAAGTTGTTATAYIQYSTGLDPQITNNFIAGKATQLINNGSASLRGFIDNNRMVVGTGVVAINLAAGTTPFITNNRFNLPSGTTPIVAAAGFVAGNTYSAAAGVTA